MNRRVALKWQIACVAAAALALPAGAYAGWSPPRDIRQSGDAVSTVVATAGPRADFLGFPGRGEDGILTRSPFGRRPSRAVVQRTGFDGIGAFSLSPTPGGRLAAGWGWYDGSDLDDPDVDSDPCCTRAVAAVWSPGKKPRRKVLSPPGYDSAGADAAAGPRGVNLFLWGGRDGMHVTREHEGRFADQTIRPVPAPPVGGSPLIDAAVDLTFRADGRALLSWVAPGAEGTVAVWAATSDRAGRFGAPEQVGAIRADEFTSTKILTDRRGGQIIVWTQSEEVTGRQTLMASDRAPEGTFGPPQAVARGDFSYTDAAIGAGGDAVVTWSRGTEGRAVIYVSRRPSRGAFGRSVRLTRERVDEETAAGVDARGRTMVLYAVRERRGQVRSRVAARERPFGRPTTVSAPTGNRPGCFQPRLAVAPDGHAVGAWRCMGERLTIDGAQGAVYSP